MGRERGGGNKNIYVYVYVIRFVFAVPLPPPPQRPLHRACSDILYVFRVFIILFLIILISYGLSTNEDPACKVPSSARSSISSLFVFLRVVMCLKVSLDVPRHHTPHARCPHLYVITYMLACIDRLYLVHMCIGHAVHDRTRRFP